jgi:hypothetical protein
MTKRAFIPVLAAVVAAGCGGGDSDSPYQQYYEPPTYGAATSNYDPQTDAYRALAQQQIDVEYGAHMRELAEQQREWERQKNADWAKSFDNPYD